jgi:hypothetical protein
VDDLLDRLERLQLQALSRLAAPNRERPGGVTNAIADETARLAREHGFDPLGIGSTRFGVAVDGLPAGRAVAKIAHDVRGLIFNLQEATFWLTFPKRTRRWLTPCVLLSPRLVLFQEWVEVVGPSLYETLAHDSADYDSVADATLAILAAQERFVEEWLELRLALGLTTEADDFRADNHGVRDSGEFVVIDYGEKWPPIEAAWAAVLCRLKQGSLWLDERARAATRQHLGPSPERSTLLGFLELAGLRFDAPDPCPCGSSVPFGDCYGGAPGGCLLTNDAASWMRAAALSTYPGHGSQGANLGGLLRAALARSGGD